MAETWQQLQGQTVNEEFHLREYLGGTEHSAVFLANSRNGGPQTAAIKLVPEDSPSAARQMSSWKLAATLSHSNLIRVFTTGHCQIGGGQFLYAVMEYAEENLSQVLPQRPLTEREAREMLRPALDALTYLHSRGLAHGRIKPANIMASGDQVKLSTDTLRRAGEPINNPGDYDPPETVSSSAADVWSLGMTLAEVLTQRLPSWDRNAHGDPELPGTLPAPLLDIARHCLRQDSKLRWTTTDIADRLNPPIAVQRARPVERRASPTRRRYLIPTVILLLALTGAVSFKLLSRSPNTSAGLAQPSEKAFANIPRESQQIGSASASETTKIAPAEKHASSNTFSTSVPSAGEKALTDSSAEVSNSGVIHQVLPNVPQKARDTIRGTVRVGIRVSVDPSGNVTDATIDSPGPSKYFANLALQAARKWKFVPTQGAESNWTLRFEFSGNGTKAFAKQSDL